MEKKRVKIGVVGLSRGRDVISQVIDDDNIVLHSICDKNPERLESARRYFTEERGVKDLACFDSFESFLQSDVEAVYLATDAALHACQAIQALEAGKHVISEIPTIDSVEDAKNLKACVNAHPELKYMAGENCCYWEFVQTWKRMYEEGRFGTAVYAEGEYLHADNPEEFRTPEERVDTWRLSYNAIKYLTHDLGPLLYIMDDKVISVTCLEPDVSYDPYKNCKETGVALFKTEKGAVIRILICFGAYVGFDHNYLLLGTRGSIETDRSKPLIEATSYAKLMDIPGTFERKFEIPVSLGSKSEEGHGGADARMMRAFIKCIIDDTKPPLDVDLGIQISLPGIFAHESAMQGGTPIQLPVI